MKAVGHPELLRSLPSIDVLGRNPELQSLYIIYGRGAVIDAARATLSQLRQEITSGLLDEDKLNLALSALSSAIESRVRQSQTYSLCGVINATGVILHTNLGRAPLSETAIDHIAEIAAQYSNLEFELATGLRGKRDAHIDGLFRQLLKDELAGKSEEAASTIVVNNNAAAVLLALNTLAEGGEVIVSRGELVEIGGSFRIPEVMSKSGAILREVGTTNRTRVRDYESAINERTRLLLRVHRSNFEITGFTEEPSTADLVALAHGHQIPLVEDLGGGALFDLRSIGIAGEPTVLDSLRAGVDVVTYSGDKLLGGPQAGIISGSASLVSSMRANSLFRALRVDKLTYAALEATLLAYVRGNRESVPALRMMDLTREQIGARAEKLARRLASAKLHAEVIDGESLIGGGAAPSSTLPTRLVALTCSDLSADELSARLRRESPPIVARVEEGRVLLDLRTVPPAQDSTVADSLLRIAA